MSDIPEPIELPETINLALTAAGDAMANFGDAVGNDSSAAFVARMKKMASEAGHCLRLAIAQELAAASTHSILTPEEKEALGWALTAVKDDRDRVRTALEDSIVRDWYENKWPASIAILSKLLAPDRDMRLVRSARTVTKEQVERWGEWFIGQDAFGAEEQVRVLLRELGIAVDDR